MAQQSSEQLFFRVRSLESGNLSGRVFLLDFYKLLLRNMVRLYFKLINFTVNCELCLLAFRENGFAFLVISEDTCAVLEKVHVQSFIVTVFV